MLIINENEKTSREDDSFAVKNSKNKQRLQLRGAANDQFHQAYEVSSLGLIRYL